MDWQMTGARTMNLLSDTVSQVNFDRDKVGTALTDDTLADFRARRFPGNVSPIGIFFSCEFTKDQADSLSEVPRRAGYRDWAYKLKEYATAERQKSVRELLQSIRSDDEFCGECPSFRFVPEQHIVVLPAMNMILTLATERLVERLAQEPDVLAIVRDLQVTDVHDDEVRLLGQSGPSAAGKDHGHCGGYTWGWNWLNAPIFHSDGHRGKGLRIGIADAGVSDEPRDLKGKIVDFMQVQPPGMAQPSHSLDTEGHGTHMAGTMAGGDWDLLQGGDTSQTMIGGAPEARIVAASVVRPERASFLDALRGYDWLVHPARGARVVNLSFGVKNPKPHEQTFFEAVIARTMLLNVVTVAAIGNEAGKSRWPARSPNVVAVGAMDSDGTVWHKSGEHPTVVAPGVDIFSCIPSGLPQFFGQSYCLKTGTSSATAHVSALIGMLGQAFETAPAEWIIEALKATASHTKNPDNRLGFGVPDFRAARSYLDNKLAKYGAPT
jgi:serine protease AprX